MRRRRFCEILKPRRNGFVRCGRACDKLAQARRDSELAVTVRSRQLKALRTQGPQDDADIGAGDFEIY